MPKKQVQKRLSSQNQSQDTTKAPSTMNQKTLLGAVFLASTANAGTPSLRRALNDAPCGTFDGCYLWDKTTKTEVKLTGSDSYCPKTSERGWSIRCDTDYANDGVVDEIKFFYDGHVKDEYGEPRWMNGDSNEGEWINDVEYLVRDMSPKVLKIEGRQWSKSCFTREFVLTPHCGASVTAVPVPAPVSPPTLAPAPSCVISKCGCGKKEDPSGYCVVDSCEDDYRCPANSHRKSGLQCYKDANDCLCKAGYELVNVKCLSQTRPPQPATCYLWKNGNLFYGHNAKISAGTIVEAKTATGLRFTYKTRSGHPTTYASNFHKFGKQNFHIRFVSADGVAGEWSSGCTNYFGTSTHPPQTQRCYMWSNKLYFGYSNRAPHGYKIETHTVVGKRFNYSAIGSNYVHANDFRSYDSQPFYLRFVDQYGNPGPWKKCVNYTPIALDLDRNGAVEHVEGEFIIDITGDGEAETLEEWFGPKEGILIDTKHGIEGGIITGHHLFGDMGRTYVDGYEKLALLDANDDGVVGGEEKDGLAIWIDANSNALLDEGEMSSLESHDIVSLGVVHENFLSEATLSDGNTILMEDKWFVR